MLLLPSPNTIKHALAHFLTANNKSLHFWCAKHEVMGGTAQQFMKPGRGTGYETALKIIRGLESEGVSFTITGYEYAGNYWHTPNDLGPIVANETLVSKTQTQDMGHNSLARQSET